MIYDKDIREPLFDYLEVKFGKVRILEEKRTGRSRADVVMITDGAVCGIEIKSDADTYARLAGQVKDYDLYYDRNYVVVGSSHGNHIAEHVPDYWGILTVEQLDSGDLDFYVLREAQSNPNMDLLHKLTLLWRPEMVHIQELTNMPKYAQLSKKNLCLKLIEKIPAADLNRLISDELFERDYTKIRETINNYRVARGQKKRIRRKYKRKMSVRL